MSREAAGQRPQPDAAYPRRRLEMVVFMVVSLAGIYALGQGLRGFFQPGAGIDLGWLAVAGGAFWVLYAQMCRVQQDWPRRPGGNHRRRRARAARRDSAPTPGAK